MKCKLISFDTSSSSTGYSIFIDGKLSTYKLLDFKSEKDTEVRLQRMIVEIYKLIEKEKPEIVVTELTVVTRNAQAQRMLTMILGAIYGKCLEKKIYYYSFRPTEWRALIDKEKKPRKREELKLWSIKKVEEIFGIKNINDDVSDAILVGQAYIGKFGE